MLTPPSTERALAAGGVLLAKAEDYVPNWPLTCGWTLRSWLEGHREIVVRFIRASVAATNWLLELEHREETIQLIMKLQHLTREAERAYGTVVPKARLIPKALATVLELRKEMGCYQPPHHPPERFYDFSYWYEATGLPAS